MGLQVNNTPVFKILIYKILVFINNLKLVILNIWTYNNILEVQEVKPLMTKKTVNIFPKQILVCILKLIKN